MSKPWDHEWQGPLRDAVNDGYDTTTGMTIVDRDLLYRLLREHDKAQKLLERVGKFRIFIGTSAPGCEQAYLRTKANDWGVIEQEIHNFLHPEPPIEMDMSIDQKTGRLFVWLQRLDRCKPLIPNQHYFLKDDGGIDLAFPVEELWEHLTE